MLGPGLGTRFHIKRLGSIGFNENVKISLVNIEPPLESIVSNDRQDADLVIYFSGDPHKKYGGYVAKIGSLCADSDGEKMAAVAYYHYGATKDLQIQATGFVRK